MTHQSNRRQEHTFIIMAKGEEVRTLTCSNDKARNLVRKYRRSLKCNVRAISC